MNTRTTLTEKESKEIIVYSFFWSLALLLMVPVANLISGENWVDLPYDFWRILKQPCKLVTDYFELGGAGAAFLNAGLCGLGCNLAMIITRAKPTATILAGYFLVIAHCFYGLNFLNMWIPFLSIPFYCLVTRKSYREHLHLSFFCTALGPFISDFIFRYTWREDFNLYVTQVSISGIAISIVFGLVAGFVIPALLPGTTKMHRGYNLYKAGLAIGLFGIFAFAFFYKTFGIAAPEVLDRYNRIYEINGRSYYVLADTFFIFVFAATFLLGFVENGCSLKGYRRLLNSDGLHDDFTINYGMPLTYINIGIYGTAILLYLNAIIYLTDGAGFTGPTIGVTIAAITFAASGQTVKNVWPIILGYIVLVSSVSVFCLFSGMEIPSSISAQGYINGMAFATGLCPFTGKYGVRYGILAGVLNAILCTSTSAMHGGLVLYNGGLAAGLTALLMIPILDFYNIKPKDER